MIEVLKESWSEFLVRFKVLFMATLPWILSVIVLRGIASTLSDSISYFIFFLISVVELILQAMIAFAGLQVLFKNRGAKVEVTSGKIITYIIAVTYIEIATMLGMFFIILGFIIMAASFFAPIYIFKEHQGPIEAVASSASLLQGKVLHVTLLLCGVWLAIYAVKYVASLIFGLLPAPDLLATTIISALLLVVDLVTLPVMVNLHTYLVAEHNKQIQ
jgi:hypothetical protein